MTRTKLFATFTVMIILCAVENTQAAENIRITNADSSNISITGGAGVGSETTFGPLAANVETVLNVADIISSLDRGYDVIITTSSPGTTTPGDIVVDAAILKTVNDGGANGSLLTFLADNDIIVNEAITSAVGGLDVELQRNGSAIIRADIGTNGGTLKISGADAADTQNHAGEGPTSTSRNLTEINQGTHRASINWDTFNIAVDETVRFIQPASTSVVLNTVSDQNPSQIFGRLDANGRVLLINPNGIIFGPTAQVNVGGLIASSSNISMADFMAGNFTFETDSGSGGLVLNQGTLQAAPGSFIALTGDAVANEGSIVANAGTIALGAGSKVALDFDGTDLIHFDVESDVLSAALGVDTALRNSGSLFADGGQVLLTARAAQDVYTRAIDNESQIQARRIQNSGGVIRLSGGPGIVANTGTIDASGGDDESTGGSVELLGNRVGLLDSGSIDASGTRGGGTAHLGGAAHGAGDLTSEFTQVSDDASISAHATVDGDGGEIIVWADHSTWFFGGASVAGGSASGNGGFLEISGAQEMSFAGTVDASAENGNLGTLLFDPTNITIRDQNDPDVNNGRNDGTLPDLSNATSGAGDFEISETGLEGLAENANIVLEATNNITINSLVTDGELALATTAAGSVTFSADTDGDGSGAFAMDTTDTIITQGGSLTITGTGVTAGNIDTSGPDNSRGGAVTLDATSGNLVVGNVAINGGDDVDDSGGNDAGNVTLAGEDITVGAITALGSAAQTFGDGADGSVLVTANRSAVVGGNINVDGGQIDISVDADEATTDGAESLTIQATLTATTINLDGRADSQNDSLVVSLGGADTAAWTVNGTNDGTLVAGSSGSATFTNFSDLDGGAQTDAFVVDGAGTLAGSINGAGGSNTLDFSTTSGGVTVNLENASATPLNANGAGGFSNIGEFTGDNVADTLIGPNGGATFATSGVNDGTVAGITYTDFANITGGSGGDIFNFDHDVTGAVNGGAGNDVIVGPGVANAWVVTAADSGLVNGIAFVNVENLTGGAGNDIFALTAGLTGMASGAGGDDVFNINDGGSAGSINGGTDSDLVTYAGRTSAVTVAIDRFPAVETLVGSSSAADTLQGTSLADTFTVTGANSGIVNGVSFTDFENLSGLGGDDTFNMQAFVSGTVDGGTDGPNGDVINGSAAANEFVVNATDSGTVNGTFFVNVGNLTGGASGDVFTIAAGLSGTANGAGGSDIFDLAANISATIDGGTGADEAVVREPAANDLNIGNVETITYIPEPLPWVTFRVRGVINSVNPALDSIFSLGDTYTLVYTFDATSPDLDSNAASGVYNSMLSAYITVGSYAVSFSSFNPGQISVTNFTNDEYRVTVSGVKGPAAAGLPLSDFQQLLLLFDASGAAFTSTALPVTALDLNEFSAGSLNLSFDVSDFPFPQQANVIASVDSFELVKSFRDVPLTYWASSFITRLAASGITAGCGNDNYCPTAPVTRAQMAVFLERGINIDDPFFNPPAASGNVFLDVGAGDFAASFIEQLFSDGITAGCGNNNYCPDALVSRAQMAVFLLRAKYGSSYSPPHATGIFSDVPLGSFAAAWIEQLAAEGITAGCGGGKYCPDAPVTRDQMAVFLVRTFGL